MGENNDSTQNPIKNDSDDENGLELSLGLSCGGCFSKTKVKDGAKETNSESSALQASQGAMSFLRPASSDIVSQEGHKLELPKHLKTDEWHLERSGSEVGSTSLSSKPADDDSKGQGSVDHISLLDGLSQELANIRPGFAPGLKFGGTGNPPDLPWVSTTGSGPNGKTISGVIYRYMRNQVRILCACHGRHMLPVEFVQHANGIDNSTSDNNLMLSSLSNGSHSTST
eukprot:TRINITY_DN1929_c0_g1_i1.p1 TRINITY_DN1929_c0_g1~~TRINITY_DN1929_c0_g1_i1.p1  ORF type:complete len:227 (-),score=49.63 TRINITY_DN1929_c0_g1_i1:352-1032(-)